MTLAAAVQAETDRCARIAAQERDGWSYGTSGYTAANTIYRKIRGELPDPAEKQGGKP